MENTSSVEDWELALSYCQRALDYRASGEHSTGLEYQLKALAIWEKVLPPDHPDLAGSYSDLAWNYYAFGDLDTAVPLMERAVSMLEKALPADHPDLAAAKNGLALMDMQRYK